METIDLKSEKELLQIINRYPCHSVLDESRFSKTRYISDSDYDELIKYHLVFEPFVSIAEKCRMRAIPVMRSQKTGRFYIGFVNTGGHKAMCEVRPVRFEEICDSDYIEKMYANHGAELDNGIDRFATYDI